MAQLRWIAAPLFTKVLPLTSKGRMELPELVTGGAAAPSLPVNVWKLVLLAVLLLETGAAALLVTLVAGAATAEVAAV